MANLKSEYIDIKSVTHPVEHLLLPEENRVQREQLIEELLFTLAQPGKKIAL